MIDWTVKHRTSRIIVWCAGMLLTGGIGILNLIAGYELSFSVFYIIPITVITWMLDRHAGILISIFSAALLYCADSTTGHADSNPFLAVWNGLTFLAFFLFITLLLAALKDGLRRERELAHTDYLTSAINVRHFHQIAQYKLNHIERYKRPFTLAYIDIDNFKLINDRYGHNTGDQVLRSVVACLKSHTRKTDVIARLGGDEFAVLMGETDSDSGLLAFRKIQEALRRVMQDQNWPITFSMGVLTCRIAPVSTDELIRLADELMYKAKEAGKDRIFHDVYPALQ